MHRGPQHVSEALAQLIALRGLARLKGESQLADIWRQTAGPQIARHTRVLAIRRGVLEVAVGNSALLSELVSFHKASLLTALQQHHADLKIRDLKFRLRGDLS